MSDVDNKVKMIVEGLLLAAGRPLSLDNIIGVFSDDEKPDRSELKSVMESISQECDDRGFELIEVASGFRFQVKQDLSEWVAKLWEERPPRYTRALLETLALIAYRQPITRGDIEEIRGVGVSSNIIRTLLDREWVRIVGHRDVPGRPAMFATTKQFLDYFNLKSLQELPPLSEIKDLDKINREFEMEEGVGDARVLELPEDAIDESSFEQSELSTDEMLAEDEAIELSKKPLDEILNMDAPASDDIDFDLDEELGEEEEASPQDETETELKNNTEMSEANAVGDMDFEVEIDSAADADSEFDADAGFDEEIKGEADNGAAVFDAANDVDADFDAEPANEDELLMVESSSMEFSIEDDTDDLESK